MKNEEKITKNLDRLKKIMPEFSSLMNDHIFFASLHGKQQSPRETKIIHEFSTVLKNLGVLENAK